MRCKNTVGKNNTRLPRFPTTIAVAATPFRFAAWNKHALKFARDIKRRKEEINEKGGTRRWGNCREARGITSRCLRAFTLTFSDTSNLSLSPPLLSFSLRMEYFRSAATTCNRKYSLCMSLLCISAYLRFISYKSLGCLLHLKTTSPKNDSATE